MRLHVALILAGFSLMLAGSAALLLSAAASPAPAGTSYGGVILIGPLPIIYGAGPQGLRMAELAALLSLVLIAAAILLALAAAPPGEPEGGGHEERED